MAPLRAPDNAAPGHCVYDGLLPIVLTAPPRSASIAP
jgi:hypothetical protein